jgi:hypothetical protein
MFLYYRSTPKKSTKIGFIIFGAIIFKIWILEAFSQFVEIHFSNIPLKTAATNAGYTRGRAPTLVHCDWHAGPRRWPGPHVSEPSPRGRWPTASSRRWDLRWWGGYQRAPRTEVHPARQLLEARELQRELAGGNGGAVALHTGGRPTPTTVRCERGCASFARARRTKCTHGKKKRESGG